MKMTATHTHNATIMIVEDDIAHATLLQAQLHGQPYQVLLYHTPQEVLQALSAQKPDLLIVDLALGNAITGYDVIRWVRGRYNMQQLPIIIISATLSPLELNQMVPLHQANRALAKPITRPQLVAVLREVLA
jgi:CheY-like chemotaxis protein